MIGYFIRVDDHHAGTQPTITKALEHARGLHDSGGSGEITVVENKTGDKWTWVLGRGFMMTKAGPIRTKA